MVNNLWGWAKEQKISIYGAFLHIPAFKTEHDKLIFSGLLMILPKRSQAYPIACGPCLGSLRGWAVSPTR